ncbi:MULTISPECIES: methyltransferase domain-containing protein [Clavibacter]|uniref:Methyltransferase domain-containing protein n=2 Tax=Clavibacter TaxID=1573 RepID=A0A399P104_9MICO|nr:MULTISPECIES: methyltransferase domain-containing protein [Clavibacter]KDP89973.1 SAM-dependent methyltransferase [Clavibacter cf. michiganensis LMG 26808]RII98506.1 methyltransferase domain-containing protein [Clavibacter michiganensis]UKF23977.1 methyltransferase domain-containing protein [Clavibacter sp. A6099]
MDLDRLASWLRCPSCGSDLQPVPPLVLRCEHGHTVDGNKRGYANLLAPGTRVTGDTAEMLAARGAFLDRGHYAPIVDALVHATVAPNEPAADDPSPLAVARGGHRDPGLRIVDAGCGTGHYLRGLLDTVPGSTGLAADLSPAAVAIAVRGRPDIDGVVADTWAALPMRDGVADLILDVFAPRNLPEFHRVLAPRGRVAIVAAGPQHLEELRASGRAVGVQEDKRERILEAADPYFETESETRVHRMLRLSEDDVRLLLGMGPSAHHAAVADRGTTVHAAAGSGDRHDVTIDVMTHVLRRRDDVDPG